jgi:hypothetical protein
LKGVGSPKGFEASISSLNPVEAGGMPMKLFVSNPEFAGGSTFGVAVG